MRHLKSYTLFEGTSNLDRNPKWWYEDNSAELIDFIENATEEELRDAYEAHARYEDKNYQAFLSMGTDDKAEAIINRYYYSDVTDLNELGHIISNR